MIELDFEKQNGLLPAIVQDADTGEVLMLAYMNRQAFEHTCKTGLATYWSRSRNELWIKGKTSGNVQKVRQIRIDCDKDTLLLKVTQVGDAACHTGHRSCFHLVVEGSELVVCGKPLFDPEKVYKK
ncbi:MAG: phosphoribosyl-AMP cyclohydrolase [Desulfatibacillaceae bacterium]|nr:phosphoribosyl-AMP cyclohydrolase [Desulfatibacillaceae bacterium]